MRPGVAYTGAWECEAAVQGDQPTAEGRDRSPGAAQCTAQAIVQTPAPEVRDESGIRRVIQKGRQKNNIEVK